MIVLLVGRLPPAKHVQVFLLLLLLSFRGGVVVVLQNIERNLVTGNAHAVHQHVRVVKVGLDPLFQRRGDGDGLVGCCC